MSVSAEDAARTLREAERMEARSATLHRYQASTPYFIMWGLITIAAYALTRSLPMLDHVECVIWRSDVCPFV